MSRASIALLLTVACVSAHAFTLGEAEDAQGRLAKAKMESDIADSEAKTRLSSATGQPIEDPAKLQRPTLPAKDFTPYGFYQYGSRTCADVLFRDVLYTRCMGDADSIDGWKLLSLTKQKAMFGKEAARSAVVMGVAMGSSDAQENNALVSGRANAKAAN